MDTADQLCARIVAAMDLHRPLYARVEIAVVDSWFNARAVQRCHDADQGNCTDGPFLMAQAAGSSLKEALLKLLSELEPEGDGA